MSRSNGTTAIGLDLCENGAKLVQLERRGNGYATSAVASFELPQQCETLEGDYQAALAHQLQQARASGRFRGRRAVATLPPNVVDTRTLTLPGQNAEMQKVLRWEAESYLSYDIAEAVIDFVVLGEVKAGEERRIEVLVASARRDSVERLLRAAKQGGLDVEAVEIVPTALCRLLCRRPSPDGTPHAQAVVDVGRTTTTAVVVNAGELRLSRQILQGGERLTRLIAKGLEMGHDDAERLKQEHGLSLEAPRPGAAQDPDGAEAPQQVSSPGQTIVITRERIAAIIRDLVRPAADQFADEIQKLLRYFAMQSKGESVQKLVLTGGGSLMNGLDLFLQQRLGVNVEVVRSVSGFLGEPASPNDPPAFAVAAGLALRS